VTSSSLPISAGRTAATASCVVIRPSRRVLLWVGLAFGLPTLVGIIEALIGHRMWWYLLFFGGGGALTAWWVATHRVLICDGTLAYGAGFGRSRQTRLDEIRSVHLEAGERTYRDRFRPLYRLVVQPHVGRRFDIDLRMFDKSDALLLLDVLQRTTTVTASPGAGPP
jgi:hypothetical protein